MNHDWKIIKSKDDFNKWTNASQQDNYALDIETFGKRPNVPGSLIMGIALTKKIDGGVYESVYLPLSSYEPSTKRIVQGITWLPELRLWLQSKSFIGWNVAFDKSWIDHKFEIDSKWVADGRIMWHLQNNNEKIRGYGLKLAQRELLGWAATNEDALKEHVANRGGKLSNGDHYMADTDVLAHYACLDTFSTLLAFEKLSHFFDKHQHWPFLNKAMQLADFLRESTLHGIKVDPSQFIAAGTAYREKREEFHNELRKAYKAEIEGLEAKWLQDSLKKYKTLKGKANFMKDVERHRKFNPGSSEQRIELLHGVLKLPIIETTEGGQPKTDRGTLALLNHPAAKILQNYSEYKKLYEMAETYLGNVENGHLHPSYDVCGTVSGRLAGFEPSVLNLPFSEEPLMTAFKCDDGYTGIHADLASIEPCVIAHYSEDEALLKVYRDGLGDIYLDLALELFPEDQELKDAYNSQAKLDSSLKERFKDLRGIAKTIHLAVSYTGSYKTVGKNLNRAGFDTSEERARTLVKRYWKKFASVANFNHKLKFVYDKQGFVQNLSGRIIRVPQMFKKDLMNRLIQSSAHDILVEWVMAINMLRLERKIDMKPILPDVHDSTSWQVKIGQEEDAARIFLDALRLVEEKVNLSVPLRAEVKQFRTFAGLKGDE